MTCRPPTSPFIACRRPGVDEVERAMRAALRIGAVTRQRNPAIGRDWGYTLTPEAAGILDDELAKRKVQP